MVPFGNHGFTIKNCHARVILYFEEAYFKNSDAVETYSSGKALAEAWHHLKAVCRQCGVNGICDITFTPLPVDRGTYVKWYKARQGLITIAELRDVVKNHESGINNTKGILQELEILQQALEVAEREDIRFAWILKFGYGTNRAQWRNGDGAPSRSLCN